MQHLNLGKKLWDEGFPERARSEWEKSIQEDSTCVRARIYLGKYFLRAGDSHKAKKHLEIALKSDASAETLLLLARSLMMEGEIDSAEDYVEQALDLNRRSADAKLLLAEIYLFQDDIPESKALIEDVLILQQDHPRAYYLLGRIAEAEGNLPEAIKYYRHALDILLAE